MSLDEEILAEGERIRRLAHEGALKIRQSKLVEELAKIEEELKQLAGHVSEAPSAPEAEVPAVPEPAPEPAVEPVVEAPETPAEPVEETPEVPAEEEHPEEIPADSEDEKSSEEAAS